MKKLTTLPSKTAVLIALMLIGCNESKPLKKPFVITYKNVAVDKRVGHYQYEDANGNTREFSDTPTAYKIGDTIK